MERKIIKNGPSSLSVTLPLEWLREKGLNAGDVVSVDNIDGKLIISSNSQGESEFSINLVNGSDRYIRSALGRIYRHGYSRIHVTFSSPDMLSKVRRVVSFLIGADIVDSSSSRCTINVFPLTGSDYDEDKILLKMLNINIELVSTLIEDVVNRSFISGEKIEELRHMNWTNRDLLGRISTLRNTIGVNKEYLFVISLCLEKLGSKLAGIYKRAKLTASVKQSKELVTLFKILLSVSSSCRSLLTTKQEDFMKIELHTRNILLELNKKIYSTQTQSPLLGYAYLSSVLLDSVLSYLLAYRISQIKSDN